MKKKYQVTGMTCEHCVARVEEAIKSVAGVEKVKINLKKGQAVVKFNLMPDEHLLEQAVSNAGYTIEALEK